MKKTFTLIAAACLFGTLLWAAPVKTAATDSSSKTENFKFIFKGTPFVKYADENGVIVVPANYTTISTRNCVPSATACSRGRAATARPTCRITL